MLVTIVYVPTADLRGPDLDRMEKVEDVVDELARMMLGDGTARMPSEDELAAYEEAQSVEEKAGQVEDLTKMSKADLLKLAEERGADADESMTKAKIAAAIEEHQAHATQDGDAGRVDEPAQPGDIAADGILHAEPQP